MSLLTLIKSKSFLKYFIFVFVIIFIAFLSISGVLLILAKSTLQQQYTRVAGNYREQTMDSIKSWVNEINYLIKYDALYLASLGDKKADSRVITDMIKQQIALSKDFTEIGIIDENGITINSSEGRLGNLNVSTREYFKNGIYGKSTITGVLRNLKTGRLGFVISEPVMVNGKTQYIVAGYVTLERVKKVLEDRKFSDWGKAFLVDKEGIIITDTDYINSSRTNESQAEIDKANINSLFSSELLNKGVGTEEYTNFYGERVIGSYEWFEPLQAGLVVELNEGKIMKPVNDLMSVIYKIAISVLLLSVFSAYILSKREINSIKNLMNATQSIIHGECKADGVKSFIEMDALESQFNKMQKVISDRELKLHDENNTLKNYSDRIKMASQLKSDIIKFITDDIVVYLNSIGLFASHLLKGDRNNLSGEDISRLTKIKNESKELIDAIGNASQIVKADNLISRPQKDLFNIINVIYEVRNEFKEEINRKQLVFEEVMYSNESIPIYSDRLKVKQIIYSLLSNSIKYSERGTIKLIISLKDSYYCISIQDEGKGIISNELKFIFDDFIMTSDKSYISKRVINKGLDLFIVKQLVELLGGNIEVESNEGEGSNFTVYLPIGN